MNNLKSVLLTAVVFLGLTSALSAASLNGVYLEAGSSAIGVEAAGSSNDSESQTTTGALGKTAITGSYGLGYMFNKSGKIGLDLGYLWTPGNATFKHTSTSATKTSVSLEIDDMEEYYVAPMLNITEDASLYLKFGFNSTDLTTIGDVNKISSMDGETIAVGTVMSWGSNLYIRTEAGQTEYDTLKFTGLGTAGGTATDETVTATPKLSYGKVAIGYKF